MKERTKNVLKKIIKKKLVKKKSAKKKERKRRQISVEILKAKSRYFSTFFKHPNVVILGQKEKKALFLEFEDNCMTVDMSEEEKLKSKKGVNLGLEILFLPDEKTFFKVGYIIG